MIKPIFQRFKNLPPKHKKPLTIFTIIYSIMIIIFITLYSIPKLNLSNYIEFNLTNNYSNLLLIITIIFAFYTTTYITVFSGKLGKKLSETNNFTKYFNKNITDLYLVTNYFYLGCLIVFLLIILIIIFSSFNLTINFPCKQQLKLLSELIIGYLFSISLFFLYWIFNITFNIISNPKRIQ
jgi:hypothetical protein